jgi:hypothetical protein
LFPFFGDWSSRRPVYLTDDSEVRSSLKPGATGVTPGRNERLAKSSAAAGRAVTGPGADQLAAAAATPGEPVNPGRSAPGTESASPEVPPDHLRGLGFTVEKKEPEEPESGGQDWSLYEVNLIVADYFPGIHQMSGRSTSGRMIARIAPDDRISAVFLAFVAAVPQARRTGASRGRGARKLKW